MLGTDAEVNQLESTREEIAMEHIDRLANMTLSTIGESAPINEVSEKRDSQFTTLNNSTKSVEQSTESHDGSAGGTANSSRTVYERKSLSINHSMLNEYLMQTQSNNAQSEDSGVESHGRPSTSTVKPASSSQNQSLTCDICKQDGIKSLSGMGRHKKGKKCQQAFAAAQK